MTSRASRLMVLQYGAERVSKGLSLLGGGNQLFWAPMSGALVETVEGWILFDTGMSQFSLNSPEVQAVYAGDSNQAPITPWHLEPLPPDPSRWTWGLPGDPLVNALAAVGLRPQDLTMAVISHLHWDHSGGIGTLAAAGVPIAIHRDELAFARSGTVDARDGYQVADWMDPLTRWQELDRDEELAPGVHAICTPGHTPGHLSFRVDLPQTGTWIFPSDATELAQNLLDHTRCGSCASQSAADEDRAEASMDRLLTLAADHHARLIPGHDQVVINAVRHPPGGHR